jgi:hypothetical protein
MKLKRKPKKLVRLEHLNRGLDPARIRMYLGKEIWKLRRSAKKYSGVQRGKNSLYRLSKSGPKLDLTSGVPIRS